MTGSKNDPLRRGAPASVARLPNLHNDEGIAEGLRRGDDWARAALFERYGALVEGILRRILGAERHTELSDVVHDTFLQAFRSARELRDGAALPAWLRAVAAHTAYRTIRRRRARRWLFFVEPELVPERRYDIDDRVLEAHRRTYLVLERLPAQQRVAFALRYIEGMDVLEVARTRKVSVSTMKRILRKAETRFVQLARNDEALREWLEEGGRWQT